MVRLEPLDASNRPAFEELLRQPWQQDTWTDPALAKAIVQWRYFERPDPALTLLAIEDDRCVAMLDSNLRPYRLGNRRILVRETADWYCIPRLRGGTGLRLLGQMMSQPEPIFALGGSQTNYNILSRMRGWTTVAAGTNFMLALKARNLAANWIRRKWWTQEGLVRAIPSWVPLMPTWQVKSPPGRRATLRLLKPDDIISVPLADSDGLVQLFEQQHWIWLNKMPPQVARPIGVMFYLDDVPVGFACAQIDFTATGLDGRILYLQAEDSLLGWVTYESTRLLAEEGAGFVRCLASTQLKAMAMRQVGYMRAHDVPGFWRDRTSTVPSSIDVAFLHGDGAIPFRALKRQRGGG